MKHWVKIVWVVNFPASWEIFWELRNFLWVENSLESWELYGKLYKTALLGYVAYAQCCKQDLREGRNLKSKHF